jgi:transposase
MKATRTTETIWAKRVTEWRASGETANAFAQGKGYEGSTLRWWSSRLTRTQQPRFLRLVPKANAVQVDDAGVVIEVGHARVHVKAGFDSTLLADVVAALGGNR